MGALLTVAAFGVAIPVFLDYERTGPMPSRNR
jgi:hypothetical protein